MKLDFFAKTATYGYPPECTSPRNALSWLLCRLGLHDWYPEPCVNVTLPWTFNMNAGYSAGWQFKWCRREGCSVKHYSKWVP